MSKIRTRIGYLIGLLKLTRRFEIAYFLCAACFRVFEVACNIALIVQKTILLGFSSAKPLSL